MMKPVTITGIEEITTTAKYTKENFERLLLSNKVKFEFKVDSEDSSNSSIQQNGVREMNLNHIVDEFSADSIS